MLHCEKGITIMFTSHILQFLIPSESLTLQFILKSGANDVAQIITSRHTILRLNIVEIGSSLFQLPHVKYVNPSVYGWPFTENTAQSVKYNNEIKRTPYATTPEAISRALILARVKTVRLHLNLELPYLLILTRISEKIFCEYNAKVLQKNKGILYITSN